ncbi:hypothetical protein BHM03_00008498 [Ensete ventricosum]|nr:hypothetical protein BHM03_00008498 [Ensete ventricosum]
MRAGSRYPKRNKRVLLRKSLDTNRYNRGGIFLREVDGDRLYLGKQEIPHPRMREFLWVPESFGSQPGGNVFSGSSETGEPSPPLTSPGTETILRMETYAEKNLGERSIFIILVHFRQHRPAENEEREREVRGLAKGWIRLRAMAGAMLLLLDGTSRRYGFGSEAALRPFRRLAERLGMWAIPAYVVAHAVAFAVCLPNAVFFEVSASLLYGFLTAVLSVISAKVLGASLSSCWIGRSVVSTTFVTFFLSFFHLLYAASFLYDHFQKPSIGSIAYTRNMAVQAQHLSNSTFSPDFRGW